ncbi:MAG TPA: hypothetical protein PKE55_10300 [Kiritimatiellia bacterium]|nr:hypothetical protein [Kiritimatiellia bacterium]
MEVDTSDFMKIARPELDPDIPVVAQHSLTLAAAEREKEKPTVRSDVLFDI